MYIRGTTKPKSVILKPLLVCFPALVSPKLLWSLS